jgi:signal peptide peptidase SppA
MHFKGLLQVFGRLWLMEESQASYWADIAHQILVSKTFDATPGMDPRTYSGHRDANGNQVYEDIFRVNEKAQMDPKGKVQVIRLQGPLMSEDFCGSPGMQTMQNAVRSANADSEISSIVLYNNSPGGTVTGTENLANEIKNSAKPVVSFVSTMMCSADYWIGSSASEIIADGESGGYNTMIGSIGVKAVMMDKSKNLEQSGVRIIEVAADQSSRKGKYTQDILNGDTSRLKAELNILADRFIGAVQSNRGEKLNTAKENVFEGDVYNVKDAIKYGLIDKVGSFDYAVKRSLQMAKTIRA